MLRHDSGTQAVERLEGRFGKNKSIKVSHLDQSLIIWFLENKSDFPASTLILIASVNP